MRGGPVDQRGRPLSSHAAVRGLDPALALNTAERRKGDDEFSECPRSTGCQASTPLTPGRSIATQDRTKPSFS